MFKSLYLHFPFCETKCHYCDFYSIAAARTSESDRLGFVSSLVQEIELYNDSFAPELSTIFMGGGTPSMTPPEEMEKVVQTLLKYTSVTEKTEWSMEANPSSVTLDALKAYRSFGVNRISMGVQALNDSLLAKLGRVHDEKQAILSLENIFKAGFDDVSVDLLCGVPGQTRAQLREAMERLTEFPITHLSCYLLTLAPKHRMYKDLPNEDEQLEHLMLIDEFMTERGFDHYEISNFCKPGKEAKHNLNYWKQQSYLGLGPSAHSYDAKNKLRFKNYSSLHRYGEQISQGKKPVDWQEELNLEQEEIEKWMLGLRLKEGFPKTWLDTDQRIKTAQTLVDTSLLESNSNQGYRLTPRGLALSDQIISRLI